MQRQYYIGSSDAASLWNKSPYKSYYTLYKEKFEGFVPEISEKFTKWGNRLEAAIATGLAQDYDLTIQKADFIASADMDKVGCTPDYYIVGVNACTPENIRELFNKHGKGLLDIKNVDFYQHYKKWEDEDATDYIEIQMQHQMMVTGLKWAVVGALIGGNTPKLLVKERNDEFIALHKDKIAKFWALNEAPTIDSHRSTVDTIKQINSTVDAEKYIDLSDWMEGQNVAADLIELNKAEAALNAELRKKKAEADYLKSILLDKAGDAAVVRFGDNIVMTSKLVKRKGYTVAELEYRTTSIKREQND